MVGYNLLNVIRSPGGVASAPGVSHEEVPPMSDPQYTLSMRVCSKCHTEKPIEAFAPRGDGTSLRRHDCRTCHSTQKYAKPASLSREHDPVRAAFMHAVRTGKISRPSTCEECGGGGLIQAHHPDYSRPFDVEWLCTTCHGKRHRRPISPPPAEEYCRNGHLLTPQNVRMSQTKTGTKRYCRTCIRLRDARRTPRVQQRGKTNR